MFHKSHIHIKNTKEYFDKINLWCINQIVAANTHIVGMQYLIFTLFRVIPRDKILKSGRKWQLNQNSDVRSIEFDNDSSNYFDNFLRNPMFKSLFRPYSIRINPYKTVQKVWLRCAISGKLRNYPSVLTKILSKTFFFFNEKCSNASGMFKNSLNVFSLLNIF